MNNDISEKIRSLNPDQLLDYYTEVMDSRLKPHLKRLSKEAAMYHSFIGKVAEKASDYVLRKGKRIASCCTFLTYLGYTDKVDEEILRVCIAIEFYRHSILVHDDLIDMDEVRRGGRAFHKLFSDDYDTRFGEGTAVFYGNLLYAEALRTLLKTKFDRKLLMKVVELLSKGYKEVNESQILDLLFEYKEPRVEEWEIMASKRAASLFKVNMLTGAILAGAPNEELSLIEKGATKIGYSFDIQDDIIGTFASQQQYGRAPGGDILLGKKPLHIVYAYQQAGTSEREELRNFLTIKNIDEEQIKRVKEIVKACGSLKKAEERSKEYAEKAINLLQITSMNNQAKNFFKDLIGFVQKSLNWYK